MGVVVIVVTVILSWMLQLPLLLVFMILTSMCDGVHGVVYFQRDDGTTCINGICYGIDPAIYKEIPMFNDCVDLRANCPERVHECQPPNHGDDKNYSLVSTTTTRTLSLSSSSSSSWRYVQAHCPKTCGVCHERIRSLPLHEAWEPPPIGFPDNHVVLDGAAGNMDIMDGGGVVQILDADGTHDHVNVILDLLDKTRDYIQNQVMVQDRYKLVRNACVNHHQYCAYWAAVTNACHDNAPYMLEKCPAVCFACHELHEDAKCPKQLLPTLMMTNAWKRGDLHRMFQSLVSDPDFAPYSPKILSRPHGSSSSSSGSDTISHDDPTKGGGPWIVQLDNFLNDTEVDRFLDFHGARGGKKRGRTTATSVSHTHSHGRIHLTHPTSHVRNCTGACAQDAVVLQVLNRLERLTGIPVNNTEPLQLYRSHDSDQHHEEEGRHDFLEHQVERMEGPRILSIVIFLNDHHEQQQQHNDVESSDTTTNDNDGSNVDTAGSNSATVNAAAAAATTTTTTTTSRDGGGQVVFPRLNNLSISPQRGRALLWPNVLNDNPNQPDFRTIHYTRPVIAVVDDKDKENHYQKGSSSSTVADMLLFRVNLWLHLRDFAIPKEMGCA